MRDQSLGAQLEVAQQALQTLRFRNYYDFFALRADSAGKSSLELLQDSAMCPYQLRVPTENYMVVVPKENAISRYLSVPSPLFLQGE